MNVSLKTQNILIKKNNDDNIVILSMIKPARISSKY